MYWKRRNWIAVLLLFGAALLFCAGLPLARQGVFLEFRGFSLPVATSPATTSPTPTDTIPPSDVATDNASVLTGAPLETTSEDSVTPAKITGFALCFLALGCAGVGIGFLHQEAPLFGPDGILLLCTALLGVLPLTSLQSPALGYTGIGPLAAWVGIAFLTLLCLRELVGWIWAKCSLDWCIQWRMARKWSKSWLWLGLLWVLVPIFALMGALLLWWDFWSLLPAAVLLLLGLVLYGRNARDWRHFEKSLELLSENQPVTPEEGLFSDPEAQLLRIRKEHAEALARAVTSERFRVDLIANVSHDLRTPLTAILGYSELLENQPLTPTGREQLDQLSQKAGYMQELVESLFELTKVSSGMAEPKWESIDLVRLLEQTIGFYDDALKKAGLVVKRAYLEDHISIHSDGGRLHQIFANLLGNAIKYALPGTRIYLTLVKVPEGWQVRLLNTASYEMDFDPEEIVQRFARGDKARSTKGSGLGLAIAQTYTESLGGQFSVEVDGDQFCAFVTLPGLESIF